jgi:sulfide:quinone oxidoreductase
VREHGAHLKPVRHPRPRVVIAGGGVAAIEALLALRHIVGEQVSVTLVAPERSFVHRPSSVAGPFGLGGPAPVDLAALARDHGAELVQGTLDAVDPEHHTVVLGNGVELAYSVLVLAVGAV